MATNWIIFVLAAVVLLSVVVHAWDDQVTKAYHFHTYFFQQRDWSRAEALTFRAAIRERILSGDLPDCSINHFNEGPMGPHPIGSFETCCNSSSLVPAVAWFMKNRGNMSILLHGLTKEEILDHTQRASWIGPSIPLDLTPLADHLDEDPICPHYPYVFPFN